MVATTPRGSSMALTAAGSFALGTPRGGGDIPPVLGPGGAPFASTMPRWALQKEEVHHSPEAQPMVIFVCGPPGCGKTDQCERLAKKFHYVHLQMKDLLEEEQLIEGSDYVRCLDECRAIPPELLVDVLKRALQSDWKDGKFIVDDFPFELPCIEAFFNLLKEKVNFKYVLYLDCNEANLTRCFREFSASRNGVEDTVDIIKEQVVSYQEVCAPVKAFLRYEGCYIRVDANRESDKIWAEVEQMIIIEEHGEMTEKYSGTPMRAVWKLRAKQSEDIFPREHSHLNQSNVKDAHGARHFTSYQILARHREKHTRNMRAPTDNFHEPMTLSQEIGWQSSSCTGNASIGAKGIPIGGSTPRMFHPKNTCAMTRHMENMYSTNAQHIIRRW